MLWAGALLRIGDYRLPMKIMSGELENEGQRGPAGEEKKWTGCVAEDRRLFGTTGDWSTAALDPGVWYNTVGERDYKFLAAWVRKEEKGLENRQRNRERERQPEGPDKVKVEITSGVTVGSLRRFRIVLLGPIQGIPKRLRLRP